MMPELAGHGLYILTNDSGPGDVVRFRIGGHGMPPLSGTVHARDGETTAGEFTSLATEILDGWRHGQVPVTLRSAHGKMRLEGADGGTLVFHWVAPEVV